MAASSTALGPSSVENRANIVSLASDSCIPIGLRRDLEQRQRRIEIAHRTAEARAPGRRLPSVRRSSPVQARPARRGDTPGSPSHSRCPIQLRARRTQGAGLTRGRVAV
jgi:hypothetical protein